jgi:hypothetical protein
MSQVKAESSTGLQWLLFIISLGVMIALIMFKREIFWIALPSVCTHFSKAMRLI